MVSSVAMLFALAGDGEREDSTINHFPPSKRQVNALRIAMFQARLIYSLDADGSEEDTPGISREVLLRLRGSSSRTAGSPFFDGRGVLVASLTCLGRAPSAAVMLAVDICGGTLSGCDVPSAGVGGIAC